MKPTFVTFLLAISLLACLVLAGCGPERPIAPASAISCLIR